MINFNFDDYDRFTASTDKHVGNYLENIQQYALGLSAETGEVTSKIYKRLRDGIGEDKIDEAEWRYQLAKELGDVLWFISRLSNALGFSLSDIAYINKEKLTRRVQNGTIHGSGDNR